MTRSCHLYALVEGVESLCQRQLRPPWCNVPVCLDIFTPVELSSARRAFVVNCCIDPDLSLNLSGEPSWQLPSDPIFGRVVTVLNLLYFLTILCTVETGTLNCLVIFLYPSLSLWASIILACRSSLCSLDFGLTAAVLIPKWLTF